VANVLRECIGDVRQAWKIAGFPTLIIGTTSETGKVPVGVLSCFKHEISFEVSPPYISTISILNYSGRYQENLKDTKSWSLS